MTKKQLFKSSTKCIIQLYKTIAVALAYTARQVQPVFLRIQVLANSQTKGYSC